MDSANWYKLFKIIFGIGVILFVISVVAAIFDQNMGRYRDFGNFGLLTSTFIFLIAYVCYQRYKSKLAIEKN